MANTADKLIELPLGTLTTFYSGAQGQSSTSYFARVDIGTPPKSFKIQFDVDTNEIFVPHYSWSPFNRNLNYGDGYKGKDSSSCHKENGEYSFVYQLVELTGERYEDLVAFNQARSIVENRPGQLGRSTSWRQKFLAVASASTSALSPLYVDGFFGLGPNSESSTGVKNIVHSLRDANLIDQLQFSMKLVKNPGNDVPGGFIIFGGINPNLYRGNLHWNQLVTPQANRWIIKMDSVEVGDQLVSAPQGECRAKFSSGISDIYGPRRDVEKIYSLLSAIKTGRRNFHTVDCQRIPELPALKFNINGIAYSVPANYYISKGADDEKKEIWYVAIMPSDDDAVTWTLSTPFLNAYYGVFDLANRRVGLAESK